ncbi:MAG: NAD(P)H-hydrate dehydratase [Gemmatimonadota bacterium]
MRRAVPLSPLFTDYGREEVPLLTGTEAARLDAWAIEEAGVPSPVLMENAGRSAALVLQRLWPTGPVLVSVGSGNNGGDGIVLARTLAAAGREVRIVAAGSRPDPESLLHGWPLAIRPAPASDEDLDGLLSGADVIVDALLGTGATGAPRGVVRRAIEAMNRAAAPVLALDLPSGVDAETGAVSGVAVGAEVTVAFGAPKLGALLFPGRERSGRLVAVEIGFPPMPGEVAAAALVTTGWAQAHRPKRALVTHKKAAGWVVILAGSPGMGGAAVLAARGALRAGAGYVQVASAPENRELILGAVPEAIFLDATDEPALLAAVRSCDVLAAGPGMGTGVVEAARLDRLLALPELRGIVLDADALSLLGAGKLPSFPGAVPAARRLLTPHPGEMARLRAEPEEIRTMPLTACRQGAARWDAALLLKGAPSVVAAPDGGAVRVSTSGSSDLARAGIGDVLTGVAGAFMARGLSGADAGALALHVTGRAARLSGRGETLLPTDVADAVGEALLTPEPESSDLALPFVTLDLGPPR